MNIITFSEKLQKRARDIEASALHDLTEIGKARNLMREILLELKRFTVNYSFTSEQEEIQFFKEVKPGLFSQHYYYKEMFEVLLTDSFHDRKRGLENYAKVLQKLQHFAHKNQAFYAYCLSGSTFLDKQYFTRHANGHGAIDQDDKFSSPYDHKLAKILAHERIKQYILKAMKKLEYSHADAPLNPLQWTMPKVALIELIYALHLAGAFNHGKTDIKHIVENLEQMFSVELGSYPRVFSEIRIRKSGQTNFLDHLRDKLQTAINSDFGLHK